MKYLTAILCVLLAASVCVAGKSHPLADDGNSNSHPLAPKVAQAKEGCIKYVTCQIEDVDSLGFRNGDFFSKRAYCVDCGLNSYREPVAAFLELGYEIIESDFKGNTIRLILRHPRK